jgi:Xaa-Pro aminopeptidase/Xaa-Pro dipeptidase
MNQRIACLRKKMQEMHFDSFLVTDPINRLYLSGFSGDDGVLLVTEENNFLITDQRFEKQVAQECPSWKLYLARDYLQQVCNLGKKLNLTALAFENSISFAAYDFLDENFPGDLAAVDQVIEKLRSVKDQTEIKIIRKACRLAGKGFKATVAFVKENLATDLSELDVSHYLDEFMLKNGATEKSFTTIVASGEHSTWPHATASKRQIERNSPLTLDFGYYYQGYTSDVTRTFVVGQPKEKFKQIYQIVLKAQQATIAKIKPGVTGDQLDQVGRKVITAAGYGKYFNHGMGHGIGLAIHELPAIGLHATDHLVAGQVVTIEPGIYLPQVGGVRIEDDILVTAQGHEILTDFDRQYFELSLK